MSGKSSASLDWLEKKLCLILANIPALFNVQNASLLFDLVAVGLLCQPKFRRSHFIESENGWQLSSINAGIRWFILSPERHRRRALSIQALPTKGKKLSRFHQLQPTETALPRRKNIIL